MKRRIIALLLCAAMLCGMVLASGFALDPESILGDVLAATAEADAADPTPTPEPAPEPVDEPEEPADDITQIMESVVSEIAIYSESAPTLTGDPAGETVVAKIGETSYTTLAAAIEAANVGATIVLVNKVTLNDPLSIPAEKNITLDLNGNEMNANGEDVGLNILGKLTIKDSSGNGVSEIKEYTVSEGGVLSVKGGTFSADVGEYLAEGYSALLDLNGNYVVGEAPTATIKNLGAMTVAAGGYIPYPEGDDDEDMPLNFVMKYAADQTAEDMATSPYSGWYADFVITFYGLENGSFTTDVNTYLAGFYGETDRWEGTWVKINLGEMEIKEGVRYPVMSSILAPQEYSYVCGGVQEFLCAMNISESILDANPGMTVKLELVLADGGGNVESAAEAIKNDPNRIAENTYDVIDFKGGYEASVTNSERTTKYLSFDEAYADAQDGDMITLLKDVSLTGKQTLAKAITIDGNGHSIIADETATWYTVSGKLNIKNYKIHLLGINSDNVTLKDIVLDCNNNAAGINIYCAQNVVFDNVSIINATKGNAALTVNGSTLRVKTAFTALGNAIALDISNGDGVTSDLGVIIESGTVLDLGGKTVKFASVAVNDMTGAVDDSGNSYFAAKDNAYYYTQAQITSRTTGFSNGLTLLKDATVSVKIKGTLDLNGYTLTIPGENGLNVEDSLTIENPGNIQGRFVLTNKDKGIKCSKKLADGVVQSGVEGYVVVYENSVYKLIDELTVTFSACGTNLYDIKDSKGNVMTVEISEGTKVRLPLGECTVTLSNWHWRMGKTTNTFEVKADMETISLTAPEVTNNQWFSGTASSRN